MFVAFIRTIILYVAIIIALRLMGKRQIGELQPSELVVTILISEVASIPMEDPTSPLLSGLIPVLTLLSLEMIFACISVKFPLARIMIAGRPSIIINNGIVDINEMNKLRLSISDLTEELRLKDVFDISMVYLAIIETNGKLSVFLKAPEENVKLKDMGIKGENKPLPLPIITNGRFVPGNCKKANIDKKWMMGEIKNRGAASVKDVFYLAIDSDKSIILIKKGEGAVK